MGIPFEKKKKKHAQTYLVLSIELPVHVVFLKIAVTDGGSV